MFLERILYKCSVYLDLDFDNFDFIFDDFDLTSISTTCPCPWPRTCPCPGPWTVLSLKKLRIHIVSKWFKHSNIYKKCTMNLEDAQEYQHRLLPTLEACPSSTETKTCRPVLFRTSTALWRAIRLDTHRQMLIEHLTFSNL